MVDHVMFEHATPHCNTILTPIAVLYPNVVPGSQGRSERSERSEQCSEHFWACSGRWTSYVGHVATYPEAALDITIRNQKKN